MSGLRPQIHLFRLEREKHTRSLVSQIKTSYYVIVTNLTNEKELDRKSSGRLLNLKIMLLLDN
jgi:hypothetical protein